MKIKRISLPLFFTLFGLFIFIKQVRAESFTQSSGITKVSLQIRPAPQTQDSANKLVIIPAQEPNFIQIILEAPLHLYTNLVSIFKR